MSEQGDSSSGPSRQAWTVGVVVIGRNEGERLKRCIRSVAGDGRRVVYVDSGSDDGSQAWAREQGVEVIDLDVSIPFTMARARNAGWRVLAEGDVEAVQFVDGDCEVLPGWIELAAATLRARPEAGAVGGIRRERYPEATIYNRLTDLEWIRLPGDDVFFLGDVMIRTDALRRTGGFDEAMIAGEEAELGQRIRQLGLRLLQLADPMTLHDMGMTRFRQWWRRATRTGHAYAESAWPRDATRHRHHVRDCVRAIGWGLAWPAMLAASIVLAAVVGGWWWAVPATVVALPAINIVRTAWRRRRGFGTRWRHALLYATFCLLSKPAHLQGMATYAWSRARGRRTGLIEYRRLA
ncbi:MAG: glycosyltransferase [Phycisphaerales bacterium]|jgi:GT2 family glycosyltransferase